MATPTMHPRDVPDWLTAYDAIQIRTIEVHAVYQQTMAGCHLAFLQAAEQAALALTTATRPAAIATSPATSLPPAAPTPPTPAAAPQTNTKSTSGLVLPADGDLKSFLFGVVADKTGYPVDILNLDQQLEADLGIDSIKRVEILSAFESQIQNIQDINLEEVAKLNTLRDVLQFMDRFADKLGLDRKST